MNSQIFTIGYSGRSLDGFLQTLEDHNIELLLDIREFPSSRKRGFSKTALRSILEDRDIQYLHVRALGSPRTLRNAVRATRDYERFFNGLRDWYESADGQEAMKMVIESSKCDQICLMCCCEDWRRCHRSVVAEQLREFAGVSVIHIESDSIQSILRKAA